MTISSPRPIRVLIVEDEFLPMRDFKQLVSDSKGVVAATCQNLADFRKQWPSIQADIAIVDLRLGKVKGNRDGWMVATEIGKSDKPMPIIICSSYNDKELWRTVPRHDYVVPMSKEIRLDQYLLIAYPLIHKFYPDAERMFVFHPGGHSPTAVNDTPGGSFLVKNDNLGYPQMIDPRFVTLVESIGGSKIRIHYEDQVIDFTQTLEGLLKTANYSRLVQVSRSTIINYNYVHGKDINSVYVKTWSKIREISIGAKYAESIEGWWRHLQAPKKKK